MHDRVRRERGQIPTGSALAALKPTAIDQPLFVALATRTPEPIGPAGLLQSRLTLLLGSVEPLELRQREVFLELDGTTRNGLAGICVTSYVSSPLCAE